MQDVVTSLIGYDSRTAFAGRILLMLARQLLRISVLVMLVHTICSSSSSSSCGGYAFFLVSVSLGFFSLTTDLLLFLELLVMLGLGGSNLFLVVLVLFLDFLLMLFLLLGSKFVILFDVFLVLLLLFVS